MDAWKDLVQLLLVSSITLEGQFAPAIPKANDRLPTIHVQV